MDTQTPPIEGEIHSRQTALTPPPTSPVDVDTDIEVLRTVPKQFTIDSEAAANWLVKRIVAAREYGQRVKQWAEREQRRADREEQTLLFLFSRQIQAWTRSEIEKLKGRRKSICLPAGTVGFRKVPASMYIDDEQSVLIWAKQNCPKAVVIVEKLSRTAVKEHYEATGEVPESGAHIEPERESFSIK